MSNEASRCYGSHEGDPATWIAGEEGKVYVGGAWRTVESMELAHNAKLMSKQDFDKAFPVAAQGLRKAT